MNIEWYYLEYSNKKQRMVFLLFVFSDWDVITEVKSHLWGTVCGIVKGRKDTSNFPKALFFIFQIASFQGLDSYYPCWVETFPKIWFCRRRGFSSHPTPSLSQWRTLWTFCVKFLRAKLCELKWKCRETKHLFNMIELRWWPSEFSLCSSSKSSLFSAFTSTFISFLRVDLIIES